MVISLIIMHISVFIFFKEYFFGGFSLYTIVTAHRQEMGERGRA